MRSKGNAPTAEQKRWREMVRELGCVVTGEYAEIHHPVGVTGRHNKVHIGHWWVLPLSPVVHRDLHAGKRPWNGPWTRREFEKYAFGAVVAEAGYRLPDGVLDSIMDYSR